MKKKNNKNISLDKPLISIVTVVFNRKDDIEKTILSVISQSYSNIEFIIIDGGSNDGTLEVIKKYKDRIDHFISERDSGIYDAMNKGINLASGTWINFMNAGDRFSNIDIISDLPFSNFSSSPLIYGNRIFNKSVIYPNSYEILQYGEIMACHQAMFFNISKVFRNTIFYITKYKIYGDYELVNRLYLKYKNLKYVDRNIAISQGSGVSSVKSWQKRKDKYSILYKSYGLPGIIKGTIFRFLKYNKFFKSKFLIK